ncbi:hypothetical protein L1785_11240 [Antribacter sp. KLBMP9083]|uniref:Glycerophosphoryl diester phosphodiesterase membrane domain-containing protein n=1 Tax=Antribacter soli TaxID=2910976 RepID=A0AA41QEA7_9MICO|nr:hypothetical protein [Antribacter soli]MCF4121556.1 hypothetical protein [Antribacter soli]
MSDPNNPYAPPGAPLPAVAREQPAPAPAPGAEPSGYGPPPWYAPAAPTASSILSDSFSWAWSRFGKHWLPLSAVSVVYSLLAMVVAVVLTLWWALGFGAFVGQAEGEELPFEVPHGTFAGLLVVGVVLLWLFGPVLYSVALRVARGAPVTGESVLAVPRYGNALVDSLVLGIATALGMLLCYLPGVAIAFLAQFTLYFAIDRGLGLVDAVRSSYRLVTQKLGTVAMLYLGLMAVSAVAGAVPVVGLVVAVPVSMLMSAYVYVRLTGGQPA